MATKTKRKTSSKKATKKKNVAEKIVFSMRKIADLKPPKKGRKYVYDETTPGLAVCVTAAGTKTFYHCKRIAGRYQTPIGRFPSINVEDARKIVTKANGEIADGTDPQAARRDEKDAATFGDLWDQWIVYAKANKKSWREDERKWHKHLSTWKNKRLDTITKTHVFKLHAKIGEDHGRIMANRVLELIKAMINKAISDELYTGDNPAATVKKFPAQERDRYLQPAEVESFFKALADEPNATIRDFALLALFTGARRGNLQSMKWADLDTDAGRWRISGGESKNGEPMIVYLPQPAVTVLKQRAEQVTGDSPFVFPGHGKTGHLVEPKNAWKALLERAGIDDLTLHDLRRTLGSWQAIEGASLQIIGKSLGHRSGSSATRIYARLDLDPVKKSVDAATTAMLDRAGVKLITSTKEEDHG